MHVTIYTKQLCSYCDRAKALLAQFDVSVDVIDCSFSTARTTEMVQRSGRQTFPQIYINGEHVGGYDDLVAKIDSGKLAFNLKAA